MKFEYDPRKCRLNKLKPGIKFKEFLTKKDLNFANVASKDDIADLRVEMAQLRADMTGLISQTRASLIQWMVTLFVTQIAAIFGLLAFILQFGPFAKGG